MKNSYQYEIILIENENGKSVVECLARMSTLFLTDSKRYNGYLAICNGAENCITTDSLAEKQKAMRKKRGRKPGSKKIVDTQTSEALYETEK